MGNLTLFCGKMGAGKSTKAMQVASDVNAVLISEDEWLATLYPGQITSFDDYLKYSRQLKPLVKSHVRELLKAGTHVVMDFPANTVNQRKWFSELIIDIAGYHRIIYLKVSDKLCLEQIQQRRILAPERAAFDTEQMFYHVSGYFEEPDEASEFSLQVIERG